MLKRIKRTEEFELTLKITGEDFIHPPNEAQRRSVINRQMREFCEDLELLDQETKGFVDSSPEVNLEDRTSASLSGDQIMEDWQKPLMSEMANLVTATRGDVLEIGFGRGIASEFIQQRGVASHTIIECNPGVISDLENWAAGQDSDQIEIVRGLWQDTIDRLGKFDGIFFHTYPLNQDEYSKYVLESATFAEHFFSTAAAHLSEGGVFTYFSNEIRSLSRAHQQALFEHFSSVETSLVHLDLPEAVRDTWWAKTVVLVKAVK